MTLAERVKKALAMRGMTQAELARRAGIAQPSVNAWVSGATQSLRASVAVKAARVLGVRTEWLASGIGPMEEECHSDTAIEPTRPPVDTATAAAVFLDTLRACPHKNELRVLLPLLVETDAPLYRARLLELLGINPDGPNMTPQELEDARRLRAAARAAERFDVSAALKGETKTQS